MLFSACFIISVNGQNSIPNGNFERWNTGTFDFPQNYPNTSNPEAFSEMQPPFNVIKTTDSYHGAYAVQLTTIVSANGIQTGYFFNGIRDNSDFNSWTGGMPFNQKPAGIRGYYKYNVAEADSATIIVTFSKLGVNIGSFVHTIGGIHDTFTLFNFDFDLNESPDSVRFAVASSNVFSDQIPGSSLVIDSVSFTGVNSQPDLMNGDFELWGNETISKIYNWRTNDNLALKTNDAVAGNYALELITAGDQTASPSVVSTGYWDEACNCPKGGYPFVRQVDTIAFFYKYAPSGNDSAIVNLHFKKNGSVFQSCMTSLFASSTYQYKEFPLSLDQTPDTVIVEIHSSSWDNTTSSFVGSNLKIDEMHFKSQPLNTYIFTHGEQKNVAIFPNVSHGKFMVQHVGLDVLSVEIYNLSGERIYLNSDFKQKTSCEIDISDSPDGIYFVKVYSREKTYSEKIVLE